MLVVGGGPAGLAAAVALRDADVGVTLVDREPAVGGVARHVDHTGFGIREFGHPMRGHQYARAWERRAARLGVDVRTCTTVTGWGPERTVTATSPAGVDTIDAAAIVLATGTRERPRSARLVPGDRPAGVLTTGSLQRLAADGLPVGRRAVVVGAEHVSFSAVMTLAHAGCRTVALITTEPRHQTFAALKLAIADVRRVPVLTRTELTRIDGRERVESVQLADVETGQTRRVDCDTVVFTGDWIPDHELARLGDLALDPATRAPRVDGRLRTSVPGIFAAGNLLHGAETAAVCARSGAWVALAVRTWLDDGREWPHALAVPIECEPPFRWISPNAIVPGEIAVPHGHFLARCTEFARRLDVIVRQGERELWSGRLRRTVPTMPIHLPASWARRVDPGEPIRVTVAR